METAQHKILPFGIIGLISTFQHGFYKECIGMNYIPDNESSNNIIIRYVVPSIKS